METRSDTTSDYLTLAVENAPSGTYDINVNLELAIQGIRFPVPMKIHVLPAGGSPRPIRWLPPGSRSYD